MSNGSDQFAKWMASIERRVGHLETAPRANRTSVRDGFTRWHSREGDFPSLKVGESAGGEDVVMAVHDEDGNLGVAIGTVNGRTDVEIFSNHPTSVFRVFDGKMRTPLISCAWQFDPLRNMDGQGRAIITSGTYTRGWTSLLPITTGDVWSSVIVTLGAGVTTADARIRGRVWPGGAAQTVYEETGISGPVFLGGLPWTIPDSVHSPSASPVGHLALLEIEARVTGGAGDLLVAPDAPIVNWPT